MPGLGLLLRDFPGCPVGVSTRTAVSLETGLFQALGVVGREWEPRRQGLEYRCPN